MLYKRGNIWWTKFMFGGKLRRYSCKTKDKTVAQEVPPLLMQMLSEIGSTFR